MNQLQIRSYRDIAEIISSNGLNLNWEFIIDTSQKFKLDKILFHVLRIIKTYMGINLPDNITEIIFKQKDYDKAFNLLINAQDNPNNIQKIPYFNKIKRKVQTIYRIKGIKNKLYYIRAYIFPSYKYMKIYYKPSNFLSLIYYYIIRLFKSSEKK
jgi:hypothetical protein